ncbi:hypothetical protein NVV93_09225 [Pseudomonas sp. LS44]|uniref:conjugative transfer protein MobI(A/C) n=1 Tax=Pseudomonas sp. LS44 TaxID=1357074 RepID=UPI00215B386D|nr:conjugative transfer protein MobI(A/C) [Pseudomonas sp. LS44]UVE19529.1 hypothetical protein NVV93_09225 [Pseudomonas sp. LS44]
MNTKMNMTELYTENHDRIEAEFAMLCTEAKARVDAFWADGLAHCKATNSMLYIAPRTRFSASGSFSILWFRYTFSTDDGKRKRHELTLPKGKADRQDRRYLGKMEVWIEELYNRYEDYFEQYRKLIKLNRKERVLLRKTIQVARSFDALG